MSEELKPCPFCGGDAQYRQNFIGWPYVHCQVCGIEMVCHGPEAWNRRAAPDAPAVQAEPVGYAVMVDYNGNGKWVRFGDLHCTERSADAVAAKYPQDGTIRVLPVYTHPPAADPVADKLAEALRRIVELDAPHGNRAAFQAQIARAALAEYEQKGGK